AGLPARGAGHDDHVHPGLLVVDRAGAHEGEGLVVLGHGAHMVQGLFVGLACEDLPDPGGVQGAHATIPRRRIVARASSLILLRAQTGSQTTSMRTSSTSGSCRSRSRMSPSMNSVAGQPIAVYVSSMATARSSADQASETISPIPTTEIGISGSSTSRSACQSLASTASAGVSAPAAAASRSASSREILFRPPVLASSDVRTTSPIMPPPPNATDSPSAGG